jgi:hypothetical protein
MVNHSQNRFIVHGPGRSPLRVYATNFFFFVTDTAARKARVFVPGYCKHFQTSLMFMSEARVREY